MFRCDLLESENDDEIKNIIVETLLPPPKNNFQIENAEQENFTLSNFLLCLWRNAEKRH